VVLEFPSAEAAKSFYASPDYRALKSMRESCSRDKLVGVEGVQRVGRTRCGRLLSVIGRQARLLSGQSLGRAQFG